MNLMPAGKLLGSFLAYTPRDPKDYVISEEIAQPVFQNGETALVCAHMQMFPRPVGVPGEMGEKWGQVPFREKWGQVPFMIPFKHG